MGPMIKDKVRELLQALGQDLTREGLVQTPARVARFYEAFLHPEPFTFTTFANEGGSDELIVQTGIPYYSLCEHHLLPFFGTAIVAYIPGDRIVGLSKLARLVQHTAAGLQNQERITAAIAERLMSELEPKGAGVVLRARHLCMEMRGVKAAGTETLTSSLQGVLRTHGATRQEFLELAKA
jgi:GTP cyclohydrolase I